MSKGKLFAICIIWLLIFGAGAMAWRLVFAPAIEKANKFTHDRIIQETSGTSKYRHTVEIALDSFSGYAILRSESFRSELAAKAIRAHLINDGADYGQRIRNLQSGNVDIATFTIDALIKASAEINDLPAVIIGILDETRGADALIASKQRFPNVKSLNHGETRFVLTADSPSETLARVVMSNFDLTDLSDHPFTLTDGPEQIIDQYRRSPPNSSDVYVLWEPFVSEILQDDQMHVVQDSSAFRGYIVDVLVVGRDFLRKNETLARDVLGCYFVSAYKNKPLMVDLVRNDAKQTNSALTWEQTKKLVNGIDWKNTVENFAHFGILDDSRGRQHVEDMIANITNVLLETNAIQGDPTAGAPTKLFNQRLLADLHDNRKFHTHLDDEPLDNLQMVLPALSDSQWQQLKQTGELKVPSLAFPPGTARLTRFSKAKLNRLVSSLKTWPQYYLLVRGNASPAGNNPAANQRVAERRAQVAAKYLIDQGVHSSRIHAIGAAPSGRTTVSFVLGVPRTE